MPDQFKLPQGQPALGRQRVRILSLSGGGYRGLFSAQVLARLEADLGGTDAAGGIGQRFDLIAGTSIGGILACALSLGVPAHRLVRLLVDHGPRIFPPLRLRAMRRYIGKAPYRPEPLRDAMVACLTPQVAATPIARHPRPLLLTTLDWTTASLHLLGSQATPAEDALGLSFLDAMLATSAAPTYFPPHRARNHTFVDGGLVANAPDMLALRCAREMWPTAQISMLSIGTANPLGGRNPADMPRRAYQWAVPVIEVLMHAQETRATAECAAELGPQHYLRLNAHPGEAQTAHVALDTATDGSTQILLGLADALVNDALAKQRAQLHGILKSH